MNARPIARQELMDMAVENVWDTFPFVWHRVRAHVHNMAIEDQQLTMRQFAILSGIERGRHYSSKLADFGHISRPAISRSVDSLVGKGLVTRLPDPADRRHVVLELTAEGERLLEKHKNLQRDWLVDKLETLSDEQVETIVQAMEILHAIFED